MSTLTDRYVWAVVRSIPEQQRADIERELRGSITDAVEGRIDGGSEPGLAESDALLELGDPDRLAAGYAGRPNWLIGPAYYFAYLRLLKVLFSVVLPIILVGMVFVQVVTGHDVGTVIGTTIGAGIATAAHLGFWPTLVFALIERGEKSRKSFVGWTPANLPQLPTRNPFGIADLIAALVLVLFFVATAIWVQVYPIFIDPEGRTIPFLLPTLWQFWLPYFFVLGALEIAFNVVVYRVGNWTWLLVGVNIVLNAAFVVPVIWLLSTAVFNPAFFDRLGWSPEVVSGPFSLAVGAMGVLFAIIDIVDSAVKSQRAARGSR
ncbi:MAG: permease prefix domain 1-containing protein [Rhodoglobus sp.]